MIKDGLLINFDDLILITGSNGFIGSRVVEILLGYRFRNLRCFVRPSSNLTALNEIINAYDKAKIEIVSGNLLSSDDCKRATQGVKVVFHLAAGIEKSFPGCYMNSVVGTRNLLESVLQNGNLNRFLNVSSFAVYSNSDVARGGLMDETCEVDREAYLRFEPYAYGKIKQDELLMDYASRFNIPYVIVRPGDVYGPGKRKISGKVGIDTFGIFLHLGGSNIIPFTYIENCAEAIVLAGIKEGVDREIFNIVDDDLPTSREFLRMYKKNVRRFRSIYVPYPIFYSFCYLWEKYSLWSQGQLPPLFNRKRCIAHWKCIRFSNRKIKERLGWKPKVPSNEAQARYFEYMKKSG